jgi:hypothetical protein
MRDCDTNSAHLTNQYYFQIDAEGVSDVQSSGLFHNQPAAYYKFMFGLGAMKSFLIYYLYT